MQTTREENKKRACGRENTEEPKKRKHDHQIKWREDEKKKELDENEQTKELTDLKNFREMVTVTLTNDPNSLMMKNTNSCPMPAHAQKAATFRITWIFEGKNNS